MTDRELLELAAKAAGIDVEQWCESTKYGCDYGFLLANTLGDIWNPLEFDGDALRLAVKLCLFDSGGFWRMRLIETRNDPTRDDYEITRRAIVRAAAEIGKNLQKAEA